MSDGNTVSQDAERQTVIDNGIVSQVEQDITEQVVVGNDITLLVEQVAQEQVIVETQVTVQVSQETQEQVILGVPGQRGPAGPDGIAVIPDVIDLGSFV